MTFLKQTRLLLQKEWWLWWANPIHFLMPIFFTLIVMTIFGLVWEPPLNHEIILTSVLLNLLFAGVLRFIKGSDPENESQLFLYYRLVPGVALPLLISKFLMNLLYMILLVLVSYTVLIIFRPIPNPGQLLLVLALPFAVWIFGFTLLGTVFSGMLLGFEKRDAALSLLLYPFVLPIVVALLKGFQFNVGGFVMGFQNSWLLFLALFDGIYLFLCLYVQETLFES